MELFNLDLEEKIYASKVTICHYENDNRLPNIETLLLFSKILETNLLYLIGREI